MNLNGHLRYVRIVLPLIAVASCFPAGYLYHNKDSTFTLNFSRGSYNATLVKENTNQEDHDSIANVEADNVIDQKIAIASTVARAFPIWNASLTPYNWCIPDVREQEEMINAKPALVPEGLLFSKIPKCASTTGMGITLRVSDVLGRRLYGKDDNNNSISISNLTVDQATTRNVACSSQVHHKYFFSKRMYSRNKERSFLWTMIRDPGQRALSSLFFFDVSNMNRTNVTETQILEGLHRKTNYMMNRLKLKNNKQRGIRLDDIQYVIESFDFIALVERMPESLVVFSMLARVPLADVIVFPSKVSDESGLNCKQLVKGWTTPAIDEFLANGYMEENQYDYMLYHAANRSLDLTIDALGHQLVQRKLDEFHILMEKNTRECYETATSRCPNDPAQEPICYWHGSGCGHKCTDLVLKEESDTEWDHLMSSVSGEVPSD